MNLLRVLALRDAYMADTLEQAAKQYRCLSTGRPSTPNGFCSVEIDGRFGGRQCPCPPCLAQTAVLTIAAQLRKQPR